MYKHIPILILLITPILCGHSETVELGQDTVGWCNVTGTYGKFTLKSVYAFTAILYQDGVYKSECNAVIDYVTSQQYRCDLRGDRLWMTTNVNYEIYISVVETSVSNGVPIYVDVNCNWRPTIFSIFLIIFLCLCVIVGASSVVFTTWFYLFIKFDKYMRESNEEQNKREVINA